MVPHIQRELDKALVKHAVELYQKKFKDISEDEWQIILQYQPIIEGLTIHLEPELTIIEKLIQLRELDHPHIEYALQMLNDHLAKDQEILKRQKAQSEKLFSLSPTITIEDTVTVEHIPKTPMELLIDILTSDSSSTSKKNASAQFWLIIFQDIKDKANLIDEAEKRLTEYIKSILNNISLVNKDQYLKDLQNPQKLTEVIHFLAQKRTEFAFLSAYPIAKETFHTAHKNLFNAILSAHHNLIHQQSTKVRRHKFYQDGVRGTQLCDENISVHTFDNTAEEQLVISDAITLLKKHNVNQHLIEYILNFANQHGITHAGSSLFQHETNAHGYMFRKNIKQIRIEVESPTKIRVITPILYKQYTDTETGNDVDRENPIYIELTSLLIEDKNPQSKSYSPENIVITIEQCFNELFEPDMIEKWSLKTIEIIIQKLIDKIPLEKYERQYIDPYLTIAQRLKNLDDASPASLVMLMVKNYKHAIDIMNNEQLRNKVITSPYKKYIDKIFEQHQTIINFKDEGFWNNYIQLKPMFAQIIKLTKALEKMNSDSKGQADLFNQINIILSSLIKYPAPNALYQILRTLPDNDILLLISSHEISNRLNAYQLVELLKINPKIAQQLLRPTATDAKLISSHPSNQLTQQQLVEIVSTYPEFWITPSSGFAKKLPPLQTNQKHAKLYAQNKLYRYELSGDSLVSCVYSENSAARNAAIHAIATDEILLQKMFESKQLVANLPKLFKLYLESPDVIRSHLIKKRELKEHITHLEDKIPLIIDKIKRLPIATLLENLNKELNAAHPNQHNIEIYENSLRINYNNEASRSTFLKQIESIWVAALENKNLEKIQHYINHTFINEILSMPRVKHALYTDTTALYKFILNVIPDNNITAYRFLFTLLNEMISKFNDTDFSNQLKILRNNCINILLKNLFYSYCLDTYWDKLATDDIINGYRLLKDYDAHLDKTLTTINKLNKTEEKFILFKESESLTLLFNSTDIPKLVLDRFINKLKQRELTNNDYKILSHLYVSDMTFRKLLKSQATLLQNLIENCHLSDLIELIKNDHELIKQIILGITSQKQTRQRLLGNSDPRLYSDNDLKQFMTILFKSVLHTQGSKKCEELIQLFLIFQKNSQVAVLTVISNEPDLHFQLINFMNQLSQKKELSLATQFLNLSDDDQKEFLQNKKNADELVNSANIEELNLIFSKFSILQTIWFKRIGIPDNNIKREICESLLKQTVDFNDICKAYLYTTPAIRDLILNDALLFNRMIGFSENLLDLYIHDSFFKKTIEDNKELITALLSSTQRSDDWYDLYMCANLQIRELMLSNDNVFNTLIQMTSETKLLKIINAETDLSAKILSKIFQYYQTTEYMKFFVHKNDELLNKMLNNINEKQLFGLLTQNPKDVLVKAIINNKHCSTLFTQFDSVQLSTIPDHRTYIYQIARKHPEILLPRHLFQIIQQQALQIETKPSHPTTGITQIGEKAPTSKAVEPLSPSLLKSNKGSGY